MLPRVMGPPRFVCLLGIDGSGKTATSTRLRELIPLCGPVTWKQFQHVADSLPLPKQLPMAEILDSLPPQSRAGLLAYMLGLEYDLGIAPFLSGNQRVLVDSYWFKIAAREKLLNRSAPWLYPALESLPPPDLVLFLDTPPEVAVTRKSGFTSVEYRNGIDDFVPFQSDARLEMLRLIEPLPHVILDGCKPIEAVARQAMEALHCATAAGIA